MSHGRIGRAGKPLLRAWQGEAVWPPPIWLMRQAGRYLPEFRAIRERQPDFLARCLDTSVATDLTLQPIRRFGMDGAILFSDILVLPWALGHEVGFVEGEGPVLARVRSHADLDRLDPSAVAARTTPVLDTLRSLRATLAGSMTTLIGFAGSPFTVACYMVEGGGSKEFAAVRGMAYDDPTLFRRLIDLLTESTIDYLGQQIEAGAEAVMLFDSWSGILPPALFRQHVIGPTTVIAAAIHERYPGVPVVGFPRLAGVMLGEYAHTTRVDAAAMDTAMDPARAHWLVPERCALQGNLDPLALVAGGLAMEDQARAILLAMRGRPFVFNLGHGVVPQTSPDHVRQLVELVHAGG